MGEPGGVRRVLKVQGVMLGLILVICLCFAAQVMLTMDAYWSLMVVPRDVVSAWDELKQGEPDFRKLMPLLSYAFLHGDIEHLLFNMLFLWIFGALAVELVGNWWMLLVFLVTAICGGLFHVMMNAESPIPMLGASGAVLGFEGLYLGMAVRWRLPDPHIWPMARPIPPIQLAALGILGLVFDYMAFLGGNIGTAYSAHLGGFVGGLVLGAVVVPRPASAVGR